MHKSSNSQIDIKSKVKFKFPNSKCSIVRTINTPMKSASELTSQREIGVGVVRWQRGRRQSAQECVRWIESRESIKGHKLRSFTLGIIVVVIFQKIK